MSQEYTEDKKVLLQPLSSRYRLLEAVLIIVALFAIYLMVAVVSFDPADPSWSQTAWHEPIRNWGGSAGAWCADSLLFIFGVMAYAIPPVILGLCLLAFRRKQDLDYIDFFSAGLRLIGVLALVVTSCGLAAISADDIWHFASGGVIGSLVSNAMTPWLNGVGGTLVLLFVWAAGFTLYTGWSWLIIAEKLGAMVMGALTFVTNRSRDERQLPEHFADTDDAEKKVLVSSAIDDVPPFVDDDHIDDDDDVLLRAKDDDTDHSAAIASAIPEKSEPLAASTAQSAAENRPQTTVQTASGSSAEADDSVPDGLVFSASDDHRLTETELPVISSAATETAATETLITGQTEHYIPDCHFEISPAESEKEAVAENEAFIAQTAMSDVVPVADTSPAVQNETDMDVDANSTGDESNPFMPATGAPVADNESRTTLRSQIKRGIGPELPRPNPVKIPTRRELASWGIKLPSQRLAEEKAKAQQKQQQTAEEALPQTSSFNFASADESDPQAEEARLRAAFVEQQRGRYGNTLTTTDVTENDETSASPLSGQNERADVTQSQSSPLAGLDLDTEAVFNFSPLEDLVDEGPAEPLFTIAAVPETETPAPLAETATATFAPEEGTFASDEQAVVFQPVAQSESVASRQPAASPAPALQDPGTTTSPMDSLIHPFLVRHEQPLDKNTTPMPVLDLLTSPPEEKEPVDEFALEQMARLVEARLADFRIEAKVVGISPGPVITRFELDLAPGVKAARISNLSRDLARSLSTVSVRVVEVIPGKPYVGLELPNKRRQTVFIREVLDCDRFRDNPSPLTVVLGKDIAGEPVVADLAKMPHLLVAGTTGSGKSVGVNAMIISMLYKATPEDVRFIMIDPKMLELSVYEGIPHLLTEVVTDMKDAANALRWSVSEMERRYKLMSALGVRNLAGYNEKVAQADAMGRPIPDPFWKPGDSMDTTPPVLEKLSYIVVLVDEFADLMMAVGKKVEELIARLAQKARAAGIHLVLATQRPSVDVITGLIKANIPTRIAFTVSSKIDSRTILDQAGGESLLGMGDMLYMPPNSSIPVRVHGAFVRDEEVHAVVLDWKARGRPQYIDSITAGDEGDGGAGGLEGEELDPLFDQAVAFIVDKRRASISGVQRQFRIGYNRAARIVEQMEAQGIVSPPGHNGNREVLAPPSHDIP